MFTFQSGLAHFDLAQRDMAEKAVAENALARSDLPLGDLAPKFCIEPRPAVSTRSGPCRKNRARKSLDCPVKSRSAACLPLDYRNRLSAADAAVIAARAAEGAARAVQAESRAGVEQARRFPAYRCSG